MHLSISFFFKLFYIIVFKDKDSGKNSNGRRKLQDRQCMYNVTLRGIPIPIVAREKQ
jgi:hypothetical protein